MSKFLLVLAVPLYAAGPQETSSRDEARLVEALRDQVIPADDAPGAKQAGVRRAAIAIRMTSTWENLSPPAAANTRPELAVWAPTLRPPWWIDIAESTTSTTYI